MEPGTPPETPKQAGDALVDTAHVGGATVRRRAPHLLALFASVALPLWGFGELAGEVSEGAPLPFDVPLLQMLHAHASPAADRLFLFLSAIGYTGGVVPIDIVLVAILALRRMRRRATFVAVAVVGSALLNLAAKHAMHRARPSLWASLAPLDTYSFPSGHAMGSMTLACCLAVLLWNTRWRWPAVVLGGLFALGVGASRVYLGVHYPSDILAGWSAAIAWTLAVAYLVLRKPDAATPALRAGGLSARQDGL